MISERLKEMRLNLNMTQQELADKIGTTLQAISMYERNKRHPDYDVLKLFAEIFDCTVDYLIGRTNIKEEVIIPPELGQKLLISAKEANVTMEELEAYIEARKRIQKIKD